MPEQDFPAARAVWQRDRSATARVTDHRPVACGGPDLTDAERRDRVERARRVEREREEEAARKRAERRPARGDRDDEDEPEAADVKQRYAVTLLRQDDSAWGGAGGTGDLG